MTSLITVKGADFSAGGVRLNRFIAGMPAFGLLGLWLFDDMPAGADFETIWDQSGNGRHAQLMAGYSPAVSTSYGADINGPHGSIYDTGVNFNRRMTIIGAVANPLPGGEPGVFNVLFGTTANGFDNNPANANPNSAPVLHYSGAAAAPGGVSNIYDADMAQMGALSTPLTGAPEYSAPGAFAITVDGEADTYTGEWLAGPRTTTVNAGVGTYWDGVSDRGNLIIGCYPNAGSRSAAPVLCRVYGYAVYDRPMSAQEAQVHMGRLRQIAVGRGVAWA